MLPLPIILGEIFCMNAMVEMILTAINSWSGMNFDANMNRGKEEKNERMEEKSGRSLIIKLLDHDPNVDHSFYYDEQGRVDILNSPFFDVPFGNDPTAEDYVERIIYQLTLAIEEQIPTGHPDVDHGFYYDEQGRVDILNSPFFDVPFGNDPTVEDYVERIIYQLTLAIEEQIPTGRWCLVSRRPTSPATLAQGVLLLLVASLVLCEREIARN
ncbi:hypothetical protein M5K25_011699 [Dendrobium thyrsiflorum]|uniref:Uncharacterized protein n=1 Tax=Dendrobium thyrsiflorum TaxID=117978 RepID=A0ABD0VAF1_DENTH